MKDIEESRKAIQEADRRIAEYFKKRMDAAREIAWYKKDRGLNVYDPVQEAKVIERNSEYIEDPVIRDYYIKFLKETMSVSREYQHRIIDGAKVSYSGIKGAFAHIAARKIFPEASHHAFTSFDKAYLSVVEGECDYAVLPIENSYAGEVGQVIDMMFHGSLYVNGVYSLEVVHNLLGLPGSKAEDIRTVVSHPQALDQCHPFIAKHSLETVEEVNTAVAAARVAEEGNITKGAIASAETADLYGLTVLEPAINESRSNATRFAVFSRTANVEKSNREGSRFIMLFRVNNEAGALAATLTVIGKHGFNLSVLRSRPIKTTPWKYYFYTEVEGNINTESGESMLTELRDYCDMLKIAGQYVAEDAGLK